MKINTRPPSLAFVIGSAILFFLLTLYPGIGNIMFLLATLCGYAVLGFIVGKFWPVNAWQVGISASIPCWLFLGWRMYSSQDPYNIHMDLSLFVWLPVVALFAAYMGTYTSRWLAIKRRRPTAPDE